MSDRYARAELVKRFRDATHFIADDGYPAIRVLTNEQASDLAFEFFEELNTKETKARRSSARKKKPAAMTEGVIAGPTDAEAVKRLRWLLDPELDRRPLDERADEALDLLSQACERNRPGYERLCLASIPSDLERHRRRKGLTTAVLNGTIW